MFHSVMSIELIVNIPGKNSTIVLNANTQHSAVEWQSAVAVRKTHMSTHQRIYTRTLTSHHIVALHELVGVVPQLKLSNYFLTWWISPVLGPSILTFDIYKYNILYMYSIEAYIFSSSTALQLSNCSEIFTDKIAHKNCVYRCGSLQTCEICNFIFLCVNILPSATCI